MSLVALAAGKGRPGVTTAALALGAVWPETRPVLVAECDPAGGSLAVRFGLQPTPGMVTLGSAGRRQLTAAEVAAHTQLLPNGGLPVLLGPVRAEQAHALGRLWSTLPAVLKQLEGDVLADCGRLGPGSPAEPILRHADLVLVLCQPTREGVLQAQCRLEALAKQGLAAGVVLIGERPYAAREVRAQLAADGHGELAGVLAHDQRAAALLDGRAGWTRSLARSLLIRSARELAATLQASLAANADRPADRPGPTPAEVQR